MSPLESLIAYLVRTLTPRVRVMVRRSVRVLANALFAAGFLGVLALTAIEIVAPGFITNRLDSALAFGVLLLSGTLWALLPHEASWSAATRGETPRQAVVAVQSVLIGGLAGAVTWLMAKVAGGYAVPLALLAFFTAAAAVFLASAPGVPSRDEP